MRAALLRTLRRPATVSSAWPAAACISRAASGVSASATISGTTGELKPQLGSGRGRPRSRAPSGRRPIARAAGIAWPSMLERTLTSMGSPRTAAACRVGAIGGRQAGHARGDEAAQRLGQREVLPDELHRDDAAIGDRDGADVDEALDDLLDEQRMPARPRADEAEELVGGRLDVQAKRDEPLHFSRRQVGQVDRDVAVGASRAGARSRRARRRRRPGATCFSRRRTLFEEGEAVLVHRVRHVPREGVRRGPRRGSAPSARRPAGGGRSRSPRRTACSRPAR